MKFLLVLSFVAFASCSPVTHDDSVMRLVLSNVMNCINSDFGMCLKEQALKATQRLGSVRQLKVTEGITIINNEPLEAKSLELSAEPEVRKRQLTDKLWESATDLMKNSDLELSLPTPDDEEESRALDSNVEEGRGKKKHIKKKLKMVIPLLILAKIKAAAIVVLAIVVIAASLFKLAVLAKIAFIAKAIFVLKSLLQKKHEHEDYGWIHAAPPQGHGWEAPSQGWDAPSHGWERGWTRPKVEGNNLAYSGYTS